MDDDWEKIINEPKIVIAPKPTNINKWDGEDEEDDVKDSWEDEEEKKDAEKLETKVVNTKPKKSEEKIAEKERLDEDDAELKNLSPSEILAEKLRIQKIQEDADYKLALETFGVSDKTTGIDAMHPTNNTTLFELIEAISKKISLYRNLEDFSSAIEELIRFTTANLTLTELQKVKKTIDNIYIEKQKIEKEKEKSKKGGKGKPKAKLRMDNDTTISEYGYDDGYDYEDFM